MIDHSADSEQELVTREEAAQVRAVLAEMTPKNRQLLSAVFLEERPSEEICKAVQGGSELSSRPAVPGPGAVPPDHGEAKIVLMRKS